MRKIITMIGLLVLLAQPASAQFIQGTPIVRPGFTGGAIPVQSASCPSMIGAAAQIQPGIQPVTIQKKHWWQRNRTGYRSVCPVVIGGAGPLCTTGGAAPINSSLSPVLVPKRHFWEKDKVQMMPVGPTGGAASVCPGSCPRPCPSVQPVIVQPKPSCP
jgi:hypothetical protein